MRLFSTWPRARTGPPAPSAFCPSAQQLPDKYRPTDRRRHKSRGFPKLLSLDESPVLARGCCFLPEPLSRPSCRLLFCPPSVSGSAPITLASYPPRPAGIVGLSRFHDGFLRRCERGSIDNGSNTMHSKHCLTAALAAAPPRLPHRRALDSCSGSIGLRKR